MVRTRSETDRCTAWANSGAGKLGNLGNDRQTELLHEIQAEHLLGGRVGIQQTSLGIDGENAAADVAQDVLRLEPQLLQLGHEDRFAFTLAAEQHGDISDGQRHRDEYAELRGRQTATVMAVSAAQMTSATYRTFPSPAIRMPPPSGSSSVDVAMMTMYSAAKGDDVTPLVTCTTDVTRSMSKMLWR